VVKTALTDGLSNGMSRSVVSATTGDAGEDDAGVASADCRVASTAAPAGGTVEVTVEEAPGEVEVF
jgi:hypothetical protein